MRTTELAAMQFDDLGLIYVLLRDFTSEQLKSAQRFALEFALPDNEHVPSCCLQRRQILGIPLQVALELRFPSFDIRCRLGRKATASMLVPETSMHENHDAVFWQDKIRRTGKVASVQPVAEAQRMKISSYNHFRFRIFRLNPRHHSRPGG